MHGAPNFNYYVEQFFFPIITAVMKKMGISRLCLNLTDYRLTNPLFPFPFFWLSIIFLCVVVLISLLSNKKIVARIQSCKVRLILTTMSNNFFFSYYNRCIEKDGNIPQSIKSDSRNRIEIMYHIV